MKNLKKLLLLLCLVVAGVQNVGAWNGGTFVDTYQYDNLTFDLYNGVYEILNQAVLKAINGEEINVTVPSSITYNGSTYRVNAGEGTISNNYVKTLTFKGSFSFNYKFSESTDALVSVLSCSQLTNLIFEGSVSFAYNASVVYLNRLECPNLTDIFFKGSVPTFPMKETIIGYDFPPTWDDVCSAPSQNVTAYVAGWTQDECDQNHQSADVWKDLHAVLPYSDMVKVTVSVSEGTRFSASGIGDVADNTTTMKFLEKNSDLTFYAYPSGTGYAVTHVYVNGTDVIGQMTTQSDGRLKYTITNLQDDVTISVEGISYTNQTFVRIGGNGTASLTFKHEGETTTYNIPANGMVTAPLYAFGSGDFIRVVVTTNGEETVEIFRNGINVTSIFTKSGTTYTYEADDWEANLLWFDFMVNVLDEAVWTIKYSDQPQIINFKDAAVKAICVNKWDTNSDGELSMAEAAAVTYFFGTPPFANNGNITSFDELQYFTSLKSLSLAFKGCTALKSVVIPASVTDVTNAFEDCVSLESVTFVPGSTLTTVGEKAFKGCASLEATFALPKGVTSIGTSAFEGCSTLGKTLGLPDGLTQISASAFKDCTSLSLIYIPKDVTTLRDPFFTGCTNLDYIAVDPENSVFDSRNCCNAIIERNVGAYLQSYLRYACKNSTIPEGVHVIGSSAFAGLPITQIELPSTITLVGNDAFTNCQYLESVVCKATTPPTYQGNPFNGISQDCVLTVPSGCTEAYKAAGWKTQDEDGVFKQIVEDKPNPTWNITQGEGATGTQVIITRNDTDEETTLTSAFTTVKINNEGVQKVTLKVPVGHMEQVTKYKVRLLSISDDDDQVAAMRNYLRQKFHLTSAKIDLLLRTLGYMPTDYDTEEEAQVIVDELAEFNATSNIVSSLINQAVSDNVSIKVILNGVDITSQMDTSDPLYATYEVPVADLTDAVWEITIDAGNQTDVNYVFIGNYNFLTAYADYNEGYEYEGSKFYVENVEGYCIGKVVENGSCINEEMGIDFQMQNPNDTFRAFRNGVDVTSQFSKGVNSIWTFTSNDPTMHEPAQWIIVADSDLSRYDVNRDGSITIADVTKLVNKILGKE